MGFAQWKAEQDKKQTKSFAQWKAEQEQPKKDNGFTKYVSDTKPGVVPPALPAFKTTPLPKRTLVPVEQQNLEQRQIELAQQGYS